MNKLNKNIKYTINLKNFCYSKLYRVKLRKFGTNRLIISHKYNYNQNMDGYY